MSPALGHAERALVETGGLVYHPLPYTADGVSEADLVRFAELLADPRELHVPGRCGSGNRAGTCLASHYFAIGAVPARGGRVGGRTRPAAGLVERRPAVIRCLPGVKAIVLAILVIDRRRFAA